MGGLTQLSRSPETYDKATLTVFRSGLPGHQLRPASAARSFAAGREASPFRARLASILQHHGTMENTRPGCSSAARRCLQWRLLPVEAKSGTASRSGPADAYLVPGGNLQSTQHPL